MKTEIKFSSVLAPYMEGHIKERESLGFDYKKNVGILLRFDKYCIEKGLPTVNVTKSFLDDWCTQTETEGLSNQRNRINAVRQLMLYMASLGIEVYLPRFSGRIETVLPHIFTNDELLAFFHEVDSYEPEENHVTLVRLAKEYRVLFRLIYCCGLRNAEGCGMATECVDLENGTMDILDSKGHKDRRVYMAEDLTDLCREYHEYLCDTLHAYPVWFFPAKNPQKPLMNTSLDRVFSRFWTQTSYASKCNNTPTVHDLRFTFVTNKINSWTSQGIDVDVRMPYLEKYLGHRDLQGSYYYYQNTEQLYKSIQEKDKTSEMLIPEVKKDE